MVIHEKEEEDVYHDDAGGGDGGAALLHIFVGALHWSSSSWLQRLIQM